MFCEQCGNQIPDGAQACPSCGAAVNPAPGQPLPGPQYGMPAPPPQGMPGPPPQGMPVPPPQGMPGPQYGAPQMPPQGMYNGMPQGPYGQVPPYQAPPKKKGFPVALIIILVILALLVGGGITAFVVIKKKIKTAMEESGLKDVIEDTGKMLDDYNGNGDTGGSGDGYDIVNDGNNTGGYDNDNGFNDINGNNGDSDLSDPGSNDGNGGFDGNTNGNDSDNGGGEIASKEGDPSQTAVTGGRWEQLESGEFTYIKDGRGVNDCWAEDEGGYYYVGLDGCLVYNNYSPDGYWADKNGEWDRSVPKVELQFEPMNNTYTGDLWTFDVYMDSDTSGKGYWWYTNSFGSDSEPKKQEYIIEWIGPSSYKAYKPDEPEFPYLISVVDDGNSIIMSSDGITDKLTIR